MIDQDAVSYGLFLVILAALIAGIVVLVTRLMSRKSSPEDIDSSHLVLKDLDEHNDAVLLVKQGGRLLYANQKTYDLFRLAKRELNLERLAQRTQPEGVFLSLCTAQGQAKLTVNGRFVEGISYALPWGEIGSTEKSILVSIRVPEITKQKVDRGVNTERELGILAEINQDMVASLELEKVVEAIFRSVKYLITYDYGQLIVLSGSTQRTVDYFSIEVGYGADSVERSTVPGRIGASYSEYIQLKRLPLLIPNTEAFLEVRTSDSKNRYPIHSYLGLPLELTGELVGILEITSLSPDAFTPNDLEILQVLASQAAIAIHSALLFREEQKRILELSGLAKLTQAVSALRDQKDLFARLVESIAPLLDVEVLGFLTFDENGKALSAQYPFLGVPSDFIPLYKISVTADHKVGSILASNDVIASSNPLTDPRLQDLGITDMMQAISIRDTVFVPLTSVGGKLGYLQIANKKDGTPIDQDDIRLLTIISGQAATIIENGTLLRQTQERAQRAEALRRIAILTGSVATLDEVLTYSVHELAKLLNADVGMIMLLDENRAELNLHAPSIYGMSEANASRLWRISMSDPDYRSTVTGSQKEVLSVTIDDDPETLPIYRSIIRRLRLKSFIDVPIVIRQGGVGELLLGSHKVGFFDQNDLTMLVTAAGQLAGTLEKSILYTQTDETLRRRVEQLLALTRVARELNTHLDLEHSLGLIYRELLNTTQSQCGTLTIFNLDENQADHQTYLLQLGESGEPLSLIEQEVIDREDALVIHDYKHLSKDHLVGKVKPPHQDVRSSLILTIRFREKVAGIIHLHSKDPGRYDDTALEIAQSLATQAAVALGNARRYQEQMQQTDLMRRRVDTLEKLLDTSGLLFPDQPLNKALDAIAHGIQESTPFNTVLISLFDPQGETLSIIAGAGLSPEMFDIERNKPRSWESILQLTRADFRYGRTYFVPFDQKVIALPDFYPQVRIKQIQDGGESLYRWNPEDLLLVPLESVKGEPLGLISVDKPRNDLRPDRPTIDALEVFAAQAVLTIENHHRMEELSARAQAMEAALHQTQDSFQVSREKLPHLIKKDGDRMETAKELESRVSRIQACKQLLDRVNRQRTRSELLKALGEGLIDQFDADSVLIAESIHGKPRLTVSMGLLPGSGTNLEALFGQRNPLIATLGSGFPFCESDLETNDEWRNTPLLQALGARAFMSIPIPFNGQVAVSLLITKHEPDEYFSDAEKDIYSLVWDQVGVILEHLRFRNDTTQRLQELNLLLEFSRDIGTLDPVNILGTLLDSARRVVPKAQAGYVALWDAQKQGLTPRVAWGYRDERRILDLAFQSGEALPGQVYLEGQSRRIAEIDIAKQYGLSTDSLLIYKEATKGLLPVSVLVTSISTAENKQGVLLVENFSDTNAFSAEDEAKISSLASQSALALENARLYQASEERSAQLQALTRVAGTITSSLQLDEIINLILDQIKEIIPYDTGTLWLRQGEGMKIRATHGFDDNDQRTGISVFIGESALLREMIDTSQPLNVGDVSLDKRFPDQVDYPYSSWLGIPLLSKGNVIGVIALEKREVGYYNLEHIQAGVTFAGQAAVALENANLYEETVRRTIELDDRSQRLAMLNRLSKAFSGSLDIDHIFSIAMQELDQVIECSGMLGIVFDASGIASLIAQEPQVIKDVPLVLPDSPLFERQKESLGIFSSEEVANEEMLSSLHDLFEKFETRSLLAIPLATGNDLHGLLFLIQAQPYHFKPDEVELARTICNQAAVAVQNAYLFSETERLFSETRQISAELAALFEMGVNITQLLDQSKLVETTFHNLVRMTHAETVALVMDTGPDELTLEAIDKGEKVGPITVRRTGESFSEYVLNVGMPFLIKDLENEREFLPVKGITLGKPIRSWLGVPLMVRGEIVGVLSAQAYRDHAFGDAELRLLSQVGNQLAVALDNARLFDTVQVHAAELESRVSERTNELEKEHQRLQMLLKIITELSSSLDLDMVLKRALAAINETVGVSYSTILFYKPDESPFYNFTSSGLAPSTCDNGLSAQEIEMKLAQWVLPEQQPIVIPDLTAHPRWVEEVHCDFIYRSSAIIPLIVGEKIFGALELFHTQANYFTADQMELILATANQMAVAINNTHLFRLIRDQADRLGEMLRLQNVETSRSHAMLEAVADGVLVTDTDRTITLFNASAEKMLNLRRKRVVGRKLEHFSGLFGKKSTQWVKRIRTWSENPVEIEPGEYYVEQIDLDDGRVVSVHLSPVIFQNDFLGTVSIFRDITHMIELDRLKSEFVGTVSHELRTPMTSIKGYVEILLMGAAGGLNEQQTHFLEIVKTNTERLAVLVNDLLDVSRIESGRITLSMQPLDLYAIVDSSVEVIKHRIQEENRPMEIIIDVPHGLHDAYGDHERVRQMFEYLLENAYQYTPENGSIQLGMRETDGEIQINIKDNGIGIFPDDLERIFERFYRGEDPLVLANSGTGLGLSIVKQLVEMHGGRIWAQSTGIPGEGSTFSFTLPIYDPVNRAEIAKESVQHHS